MTNFRFPRMAFFCFVSFFLYLSFSAGQDVSTTPEAENSSVSAPVEPLEVKLSVKEVRLDAVVLDNKGNPITDLTAADFEVFQDGVRQKMLAVVYVDSRPDGADVVAQSSAAGQKVSNIPQFSATALKKEDVRRTIVFLVDDYAMTFENGYYSKMALRNFVEKQMQPGDLITIINTGYGNRDLNMFYSDKRELLARINALPTAAAVRPIDQATNDASLRPGISPLPSLTAAIIEMQAVFDSRNFYNMMSSLSYSLRALTRSDLPGRKIINTITPTLTYGSSQQISATNIDTFYESATIHRLADEALRAGIVINFLGAEGLNNFVRNGADASVWSKYDANSSQPFLPGTLAGVQWENIINRQPLNPLPDMTGGVMIRDRNFFLNGLGEETEGLMRGYYLISYVPPPDTFEKRDMNDKQYRRLKVNVKRKGAKVHTRDGFFGRLENEAQDNNPEDPLFAAIHSPFQSTDINVDIAAGYVRDAKAGYLVRSWIHIDSEEVKIVETEEGGRIDLEAVILTSDISGNIQDSRQIEFTLSKTSVDWVRKHGLRFSMLLPVKKTGSYYVRISVQDKESGKVGSAYQFLEIPDVGKKGLALSNIFMITSADDLEWMRSNTTEEISKGVFFPMVQEEGIRSPALRTYTPGDVLNTLVMLYNADPKGIARSEIETQSILYKDGKELQRGNPAAIIPDDVDSSDNSVPLVRRFTLGTDITPGDYALQIIATDKKNDKKPEGVAVQTLGFTVVEK